MKSFRKKLPSRSDAILSFGWCVFLMHVWAIINILVVLPSWALRLGFFELLGVSAYPLVFALLESILVWGLLVCLALLLPHQFFRIDFVSQTGVFIFILAILAGSLHYSIELVFNFRILTIVLILAVISLALILSYQIPRAPKFSAFMRSFLIRVSILSGIYISVDLLGLIIVMARNV